MTILIDPEAMQLLAVAVPAAAVLITVIVVVSQYWRCK